MTLPQWMYGDPSEIADRMRENTEKEVQHLKLVAERQLVKNRRRIRKSTKRAMAKAKRKERK